MTTATTRRSKTANITKDNISYAAAHHQNVTVITALTHANFGICQFWNFGDNWGQIFHISTDLSLPEFDGRTDRQNCSSYSTALSMARNADAL